MKTWLKRISIVLLTAVAILIIWDVATPSDPGDCSICGHLKCHAPCVLNLATGEIGELELYQPHFRKVGEIAEEQTGGTFSFIYPAGLQGIRLTDPWYIEVDVPTEGDRKNNSFFCERCWKILDEYEDGYVLIDLYDLGNPVVYDIEDGATYKIRCYQIQITTEREIDVYHVRMDGILK